MEGFALDHIIVKGGKKLQGKVRVEGAKNAVLPVLAGALLASEGKSLITEVPNLADVYTIQEVLRSLNVDIEYFPEKNEMHIDASATLSSEAQFEYVRKMRASILVMGPVLARNGFARVALPGGCAIGSRPIDQHLKGFEAMGANITFGNGFVEAKTEGRLRGAKIYHERPCFYTVRNDGMVCTVQGLDAFDAHCVRTGAFDVSAHFIDVVRKVNDFRLFCRIFDDRYAICKCSSRHDVLCCADTREIEVDFSTA